MDKPITMRYEEFKHNLTSLINNSDLPLFIIEGTLQNYLYEVSSIVKKQYQHDVEQYKESLSKPTLEENKE